MRNPVPEQRSLNGLPKLYQKYIGHDNNRDFFGSTQPETENMNRVLYREWFPQIVYNHHQSGPAGTILWSPPLLDPFNYNQDPLLPLGIQTIGLALHTRLAAEGKPGATARSGGSYDGWWNGGLRNTAAFHNTIAILTEMIGSPTPMRVPLVLSRQIPNSDLTFPVPPQEWHFRQSIDYSVTCNRAVLDVASRMKENFLFNRYVMGHNSIERGSRDTWTAAPHRYARIADEVGRAAGAAPAAAGAASGRGGRGGTAVNEAALWAALHKPEDRDPRGYILPSTQRDFTTATLPERSFDLVISVATFHHLPLAAALARAAALVAPGGRLIVVDLFEPAGFSGFFYNASSWWLARRHARGRPSRSPELRAAWHAHEAHERMPSLATVRDAAKTLPGARLVVHPLWRWSLEWRSPA